MIHGITFATDNMSKSLEKCAMSLRHHGCATVDIFSPNHSQLFFLEKYNRETMEQERGAGYWLWKPWIINHTLLFTEIGDYIVYADAGVEVINNLNFIIDRMGDQDVWLFGNKWAHIDWCKADVIKKIIGLPYQNISTYKQAQASVIIVRNTPTARAFIKEWLLWCQMPGLIDDSPSKTPNWSTFQEHRHDQAILTTLAIRDNIPLHWWPASYNNGSFAYPKDGYETDKYPVLFNHHRKRNNEYV